MESPKFQANFRQKPGKFQFGHGGEPWSHFGGQPLESADPPSFNSATAVSRGVTGQISTLICAN